MSDLTDSENPSLSVEADFSGSANTSSSPSTESVELGAARLEEILEVGPSTRPDAGFVVALGGSAPAPTGAAPTPAQPAPAGTIAATSSAEGRCLPERAASEASTSGRVSTESPESSSPPGEPINVQDRDESCPMRINNIRVVRRADTTMVDLAGGRPIYTPDFYTFAVTDRYLAALRQEFCIPEGVLLKAPGENDLLSRLPHEFVALSVEYFRAGL